MTARASDLHRPQESHLSRALSSLKISTVARRCAEIEQVGLPKRDIRLLAHWLQPTTGPLQAPPPQQSTYSLMSWMIWRGCLEKVLAKLSGFTLGSLEATRGNGHRGRAGGERGGGERGEERGGASEHLRCRSATSPKRKCDKKLVDKSRRPYLRVTSFPSRYRQPD
jgi:hypothetical protein